MRAYILTAVIFASLTIFAFWPTGTVNTPRQWCEQYPAVCAVNGGQPPVAKTCHRIDDISNDNGAITETHLVECS